MLRTLKRLLFPVLNALGPLLIILAAAQLLPIAIAYRDGENVLSEFFTSAAISLFVGLLFALVIAAYSSFAFFKAEFKSTNSLVALSIFLAFCPI